MSCGCKFELYGENRDCVTVTLFEREIPAQHPNASSVLCRIIGLRRQSGSRSNKQHKLTVLVHSSRPLLLSLYYGRC